jgi:beta-glucosidase/6-phospho-beta-glucosidase/beta-galactosidase
MTRPPACRATPPAAPAASSTPPPASPFARGTFTWLVGIEDTCIYPPPGAGRPPLDEHVLTGHDRRWAADLAAAADLGATAIRYGVSWPRVHLAPGRFDWAALDAVLHAAAVEHRLTVVADLVHYGCPPWLPGSFADPGFPAALADFTAAFAARYRGLVDHLTPLNEPLTTASFCGLRGIWPPYRTGWAGWTAVTLAIAEAVGAAIAAARAANPGAVIVHVEAASPAEADPVGDQQLRAEAARLNALADLPTDLLLGHVTTDHPLHGWLLGHGADPHRLDALARRHARVDLLGVNYYPQLSPRRIVRHQGRPVQLTVDRGVTGLVASLTRLQHRYQLPLLVTETSTEGSDETRRAWLAQAAAATRRLATDGVDVRGLTWWPLFDFVDWSYTSDGHSVEEFLVASPGPEGQLTPTVPPPLGDPTIDGITPFLRRMGLLRLTETGHGTLALHNTIAADTYRDISNAHHSSAQARRGRLSAKKA